MSSFVLTSAFQDIRKAMDIDLDNAIVILDEAHNIEGTARDAGGLDVQHEDLKQANREFGDMIKHHVLENSCRKLMDVSNGSGCCEPNFVQTNWELILNWHLFFSS